MRWIQLTYYRATELLWTFLGDFVAADYAAAKREELKK